MIKTLQHKFVKTAMTAITVLLIVVILAISALYTFSVYSGVRSMIEMLADNGGVPEPRDNMGFWGGGDYEEDLTGGFSGEPPEGENSQPDREGGKGNGFFRRENRISPDNAMSARYFLVRFAEDGTVEKTDTSKIYSVTEEEADEMAQSVLESGRDTGIKDRFLYLSRVNTDGTTVVFMDISSQISSLTSMILISLIILAVSWVLMLLFVMALSKRAIAPIAENIVRQKQFVTNAGHELKTPLAIIMANTEALELFNGESKWTRNIKSQTQRLSGLMQNLLTLSKMDEAGMDLPIEQFDLGSLIGEAAAPFEEPAREKKIEFTADTPSIMVKGHRESVGQLIGILLDNAVKYTPAGGRIRVTAAVEGTRAVFREENSIEPAQTQEDPERLFDRFYRKDSARTQKSGGYGIGLSAARAIADANRAEINAEYKGQDAIVFNVKLMI